MEPLAANSYEADSMESGDGVKDACCDQEEEPAEA